MALERGCSVPPQRNPVCGVTFSMNLAWLLWVVSILPPAVADQTCLAATVYLEARSESRIGQMAVAEVAMRRRETGRWGDTVCDVVGAHGQFALSMVSPILEFRIPKAWSRAWNIAGQAIQTWNLPRDQRQLVVPYADHFIVAESVSPDWIKGPPLATIGAHNFYRVN
jgi:spore germination cell wall hydrolase CwlJ-like protein